MSRPKFVYIQDAEWDLLCACLSEPDPQSVQHHVRLEASFVRRMITEIDEMRRNWMHPDEFAEILRKITSKAEVKQ